MRKYQNHTKPEEVLQLKKFLILLITSWSITILLLFAWNLWHEWKEVHELARNEAASTLKEDLSYRYWAAVHGGVYVPVTEITPPNPYLKHMPERDIVTPSGRRLTLMNPAYMTRQVHEMRLKIIGNKGHITSLRPLRPENAPDEWEKSALKTFEAGRDQVSRVGKLDDLAFMRLMWPLKTKSECLKCHASQGYKKGEIRGGISVSIPMGPHYAAFRSSLFIIVSGHALIWLIGLTGLIIGRLRINKHILERKKSEAELIHYKEHLEDLIKERTADLEQEISERKKLEESLRQNDQTIKALLNATTDAIFLLDTDYCFIALNDAMAARFNKKPEELIGVCIRGSLPPDLIESREKYFDEVIHTGEPLRFKDQRNGIWMDSNIYPVFNNAGIIIQFAVFSRDITEEKQNYDELKKSEKRLRMAAASTGIALWEWYVQEDRTISNDESLDLFGYTKQEQFNIFKFLMERIHQEDYEKTYKIIESVIEGKKYSFKIEFRYNHPGKGFIWLYGSGQVMERDSSGKAVRIVGINQDITDHKKIEASLQLAKEKAEAANLAKTRFLANMNHELRTPLNSILGFSQLMENDQKIPIKQRKNLQNILQSGKHLLGLINEILELAKIESGKSILNTADFNLYEMLKTVLNMIRYRTEKKGLNLIMKSYPDISRIVKVDGDKLRQVLINLLGNAVKFTDKGSITLNIRTEKDAPDKHKPNHVLLHFEICDTGPGILPEDQETIFEAFTQSMEGRNKPEGTGLGLTISREYLRLMGGDISLTSKVGEGTTFQFHIPVDLVEGYEQPSEKRQVVCLAPDQPDYNILIVEDNIFNRMLLTSMLKSAGFNVESAKDGLSAIEQYKTYAPDLIWMDMHIPDISGVAVTKTIREMEKTQNKSDQIEPPRHTFIIALTADVSDRLKQDALIAGCDDFMTKPFITQEGAFPFSRLCHQKGSMRICHLFQTIPSPRFIISA